MGFGSILVKGKDKAVAVAMKKVVNSKIEKFGHVADLVVDTKERVLDFKVVLQGEAEPLEVKISGYSIVKDGDESFVSASEVVASRAWINILFNQYLENQRLKVPEEHVKYLDFVS